MKDKLVRTGHKKAYYRLRAFGVSIMALAGFSAIAATPIAISYGSSYGEIAQAQAGNREEPRLDDPEVEDSLPEEASEAEAE